MGNYLIVGAGLFGATIANLLHNAGKEVRVVEKEDFVGGACRTYNTHGIDVHMYGAHIFKTNDKDVWQFVNQFSEFKPFLNTPIAISKGEAFNLPFNMNTFARLWNISLPSELEQHIGHTYNPLTAYNDAESFAISKLGYEVYERFIKGYTEKQWGRPCNELPASILGRLPIRYTYDNNYYNTEYQGVPSHGYTALIRSMLQGIDVQLNCNGRDFVKRYNDMYDHIIYTGTIDGFYNYSLGKLEYRSLEFKTVVKDCSNYQGNAVFNYTDADIPFTRVIEHNHFLKQYGDKTVVTYEYPADYVPYDNTPYYPIPTQKNRELYEKYLNISKEYDIIFSGRLGSYKYTDMSETVRNAMNLYDKLIKED